MKRRMLALLLAVLTLTMLTAAAFAADETELGAYNLTGGLKVVGVESASTRTPTRSSWTAQS